MSVLDLLDRPIAYHRVFATLTGSVKAAVMLSQAVYWQKRAKQKDGWWYKTAEEWEEETGLSRHEQDSARKACEKYLKSDLRGVPATLFWRIDEAALSADLLAEIGQSSLPESGKQESRKAANIKRNTETTPETPSETDEDEEIQARAKTLKVLYESSVGPITSLVMDNLEKAAKEYTDPSWYHPAFEVMKENADHRSWTYVEKVLKNWKEHYFGWKPGDRKNARTQTAAASGDPNKYIKGEYAHLIEH